MLLKHLRFGVFFNFLQMNIKSFIFLIAAILFATTSAVVVFWSFKQVEVASAARQRSQLIIKKANLLLSEITDAETGMRGFVLTNDKIFLQPYSAVINSISPQLKQLQQLNLATVNSTQYNSTPLESANSGQKHLNTLIPLLDSKISHMTRAVDQQLNKNQTAAIRLVKSTEGLQLMQTIRLEMQQFIHLQESTLAQNEAMFQSTMRRFFNIIRIGSALSLLFALIFAYFFNRESRQKTKNIVHTKTQHLLKNQENINDQLQKANIVLEDSEEKLAVTLNSIGDAVIATDILSRVTSLNKVAETLTGWTPHEAIGRPIDEIFYIVDTKTRQPIATPVLETLSQAKVQYLPKNTLLISRDGHEYNIADTCAPIFSLDNTVQGAVLVFRDTTEQEAVQSKLRTSEELYRATFDHASVGIAHVAINGKFLRVNEWLCNMLGYSTAELLGRKFQDITYPEDLDGDLALFEQVLTGKIEQYNIEKRYVQKNKTLMWICLSVSCIRHANGEVDYFIAVIEDISKRKQATKDGRRFFTLSQELLCIVNFNGFFTAVNEAWQKMLGYTEMEILAKPYIEFVHADDRGLTKLEMAKLMHGGADPGFENRYVCKDGSVRWLLWSIAVDADNKQFYCSARDITERKQNEKDLVLRTNQFKTLLDAAPIGIYLVDADLKIRHYNHCAVSKSDQDADWQGVDLNGDSLKGDNLESMDLEGINLEGKDLKEVLFNSLQKTNAEAILKQFRKTLKTGLPYTEAEFVNYQYDTGITTFYSWQINRIILPDGKNGVVCYFQDITERVLDQRKIIENETRFRTLFDRGPVAMYFCDKDGKIQEYNNYAAEIWQSEPKRNQTDEDFRKDFKFYLLNGTLIPFTQMFMMKVLAGDLPFVRDQEVIFERADGSRVNVVINIVPIKNSQAEITGAMNCFFDVTYRTQAEVALLSYTYELKEAKALAEKANAAKSDFLSSMSHELRTPLNSILGFAQLLQSSNPAPTVIQQRNINQILQSGWYLLELINEILDLAQIESGKQPLLLMPVLLNQVLSECAMLIEPLTIKHAIKVTFAPLPAYTFVNSDKTRLKQIIINLLSNAIKYNQKDGVVTVDYSLKDDVIKLSVRDTGSGLNSTQLEHLFEPFNRLGQNAGDEEGTGIGLVVSKKLIELMHGEIGVSSKVNHGSVFWITLNLVNTPKLVDAQMPLLSSKIKKIDINQTERIADDYADSNTQDKEKYSTNKLLYIEDNQANLILVEEMLVSNPHINLQGATDGGHGLKMASTWLPDVILLDINLTDMDGYAVLKALASDSQTAHIPVIAISANAMQADIQKGIEAGFFRYLIKPVKLNDLMESLEFAFDYAKLTQFNHEETN